ncbi:MAG: NAD(P)-binding protein [Eubacterium sp.]|nr:NAD(P)-binding protein [Eubacterium sp.]
MIRVLQVKVPIRHEKKDMERKIRKLLHLKPAQQFTFQIRKQSVDARRGQEPVYVYTVDVDLQIGEDREKKLVEKVHNKNIMLTKETIYQFPQAGTEKLSHRPVIVGSGPAGLFCAWLLALYGYQPVVVERGKKAEARRLDVERFWQEGALHPSSNVQFGEGGAGTFSDGKLNTLVKDPVGRNRFVLETFVQNGADSSILYVNKPHIGTDRLIEVVSTMRKEIIRLGGTFYFETCLADLQIEGGKICSITVENAGKKRQIPTELLVLAIGHSARDTFEMLLRHRLKMEAKAFAVGLRVEHPQEMIDLHQYHGALGKELGAASYKVTASYQDIHYQDMRKQRGIYSFCMCPGGYVVNASSEQGALAVNGMSYQKRDGKNANSAIIVSVTPDDFPGGGTHPLDGIAFQRELEKRAYALSGGSIPQQLYGDYKQGKVSTAYGAFASQAKGACAFADLSGLLPEGMKQAFLHGMEQFGRSIPGFDRYDAILSGIESRTSSPVRIVRNAQYESAASGIYPCGEGAGYAGGILSAAMDGMKVAEAIRGRFLAL